MKLKEWYEQEVVRKKMCVECTNVTHMSSMSCLLLITISRGRKG